MRVVAILAAAIALAGCGGAEDDPLASFRISNEASVVYSSMVVLTRGEPPAQVSAARAEIYPATLRFVDAIRAGRDEVGDDKAFRELVEMASSVEGWCDECHAVLQREIENFDG